MLEIDTDRMKNGKAVGERLTGGESKGYPWSLILAADGETLITGDGPQGNIGCPVTPEEAAHFLDMLRKTKQRVTDEELAVIHAEHDLFANPIRERMKRR